MDDQLQERHRTQAQQPALVGLAAFRTPSADLKAIRIKVPMDNSKVDSRDLAMSP